MTIINLTPNDLTHLEQLAAQSITDQAKIAEAWQFLVGEMGTEPS